MVCAPHRCVKAIAAYCRQPAGRVYGLISRIPQTPASPVELCSLSLV